MSESMICRIAFVSDDCGCSLIYSIAPPNTIWKVTASKSINKSKNVFLMLNA